MPFYAFLHPIWQIGIFILGISNAQLGMSSKKFTAKAFPLSRHRSSGWIFLFLVIIGAFFGKIVNNGLKAKGINLKLAAHQPIGIIIIILLVLSVLFSEIGLSNREKFSGILKWHPWLCIFALGFLMAQAFIGILALIGV